MLAAESGAALLDRDPGDGDAARVQLARVRSLAREAMEELRTVIEELRPLALETEGLAATLRKHVDVVRRVHASAIAADVTEVEPPPGAARDVLRIAQEALHNAVRHAEAQHIALRLTGSGDVLVLEVADDGAGFDVDALAQRSRRLGLSTMRERARAIGGALRIDSAPGAGTTVRLEVPVDGHA